MTLQPQKRPYYPALDGIRGIAILLVILRHNFDFLSFTGFAWVGVDIFFVLSGFLITDILLQTRETENYFRNFFIRRALRILPLYYIIIFAFLLISSFLPSLKEQHDFYQQHQGSLLFHLQNWLYIFNEGPHNNMFFAHMWSLSLEEQFYLVWPFVILACRNLRKLANITFIILGLFICARIASWLLLGNGNTNYQFQYMTRGDGLCIGSLIAIWRWSDISTASKNIIRLALVVTGLQLLALALSRSLVPGLPHFRFIGYTSIAMAAGVFINYTLTRQNRLTRLLSTAALTYIGKISYGLYIYHIPILILFRIYLGGQLANSGLTATQGAMLVAAFAFVITLLVSTISYFLFEKKLMALKEVLSSHGFFPRMRTRLLQFLRPTPGK